MTVLAIDPGPVTSGWVEFDGARIIDGSPDIENADLEMWVVDSRHPVAIEWITSYGMAVGADVFETCKQIGRFDALAYGQPTLITRLDVKLHICGSSRAKDANIRQALIDRFGGVGGKAVAVGTKAAPGPLYGCRKHMWAALAVAVTWWDQRANA